RAPFRLRPPLLCGAALGLALAFSSSRVLAQADAPPAPGTPASASPSAEEEYVMLDKFEVVAGFRGSLAAAAEMKESIPIVAEVIAAEDIGKLPDLSIADSLARVTGLATQRLNGRSQAISIRGLTADFTTGLLNGREQVSTGSNRAIEFDQYPAELLSGAVVYKTTQASLIGQGLAGTIDLRTVRPLSHGRRSMAVNAFYEWTELDALNAGSEKDGYRYTASYIDQFMDGKLGIAFGYSHADKPGQGEQWQAWGYPTVDADPATPFVLGGAKPFVRSSELERDGFMGVIEYKPSKSFHTTLDLYYSKFEETQLLRGIEFPLFWSSAQLQPGYTVDNGVITNATFNNVFGVVRNDVVFRDDDVYAAGWNFKFGDGSGWTTIADISYSRIERKDTVLETNSGAGSVGTDVYPQVGTPDSLGVTLGSGTGAVFTPSIDYTDANLIQLRSPQHWGDNVVPGGQVGYLKNPTAEDELTQAKLSTSHGLERWFNNVEIGASYGNRTKSEVEDGFYLALPNGATSAPLPPSIGVTNLSFIGIPGMVSYDPLAALHSGAFELLRNPNADVISRDWEVEEKVSIAYLQLGFESKVASRPLTGNVGFQLIHTDQSSTGLAASGTGTGARYSPVSGGKDYYDFVPSLNLTWKLADRQYLRFGVSRQLARQRMANMRAGTEVGYNAGLANSTDPYNGPWTATGGNPELQPWRSNSVDVAYEHYFRESMGYFSLAGFYKELRNYTYDQVTITDFSPYSGFITGAQPAIFEGKLTRPVNGEGGELKGVEATLSLASDLITKSLPGFGIVLGGAYTESSIEPFGPGSGATPIPGLSRKVASITFYYERHGFSARISERYRSEYRGNIDTFGPRNENFRIIDQEQVVDAQVSYEFRNGPLKGLTVIVQGYNLTNEPLVTRQSEDTRLVMDYQNYGASYSAGVSYKF
ncbi:MAG TPA: TonB-dependent receptor, partial [Opitutaceae bacterium]